MNSRRQQDETLFFRLLALLGLLTIILPAVIGFIIYSINRTSHIEQTAVLMRSLAADRELATRLLIEKKRDALAALASDANTRKLAKNLNAPSASDTEQLEQMVRRSPFFIGLSLIDMRTGGYKKSGILPQEFIELFKEDFRSFSERPLLRAEVLPDGQKVLLLSQPVSGLDGAAVMIGVAKLALLNDIFSDRSMLGETGESFLSDQRGIALTSLRYSTHGKFSHPIDASAMLDCLKGNSREFVITPDYVDVPTAMSYRPVEGYGGCVMVHMRASEVVAPVNTIRNMVAAIVAIVMLAVALISFLIVRKLLRMGKVRDRLEDDLARHVEHMEAMVAERTSLLEKEVKSRIEAEERLRENKTFLENIVNSVHEVISVVSVSPDGFRLIWMNANGERLAGASSAECQGRTLQEAFGPETGQMLCRRYSECLEKGVINCEETIDTQAGPKVFMMTLVPVKDDTGRVTDIVSSAMDMTERKQLEGEMVKAQKLESLGVLAGGIAHDFNNFLAVIRLNVSLLNAEANLSHDGLEMLKTIETSTALATTLTNQLLTFAKGGRPVKRPVRVAGLLKDIADFSLRGTKTACRLDIKGDLPHIEADSGQIAQVISNMLINADQALPEGGVVALSAEAVEITPESGLPLEPGKYVKITISDDGTGIRAEDLPRIFDPYFTTKKNGSGLGLASSYSIIKNHSGHISVTSRAGHGTVFEVLIPGIDLAVAVPEETGELTGGTGRVLLMDDDDLVRRSIKRVLESLGYTVVGSADGREAVLEFRKAMEEGSPFDAVILDLTVPGGMGGEEAVGKILELDRSAKVIVSSGYSDNAVISDYERYGFCGFLQKPYDTAELGRKLRAVLMATQA